MSETKTKLIPPKNIFEGFMDFIDTAPPRSIPTGVDPIDSIIGGANAAELLIVAGRPSQGKTALGVQMGITAALDGYTPGIFSLEMPRRSLAQRIVCAKAGIDYRRVSERGRKPLSKAERDLLLDVMNEWQDMPIKVDDRGNRTAEQIYETALWWKKEFGVDWIMIDYIGLVRGDIDNRQEIVGQASMLFKEIAKDCDCPVVALCQLNRGADGREPKLSDLRDSGQIEQNADTVLMPYYPNAPHDREAKFRECLWLVQKQRNGPLGTAHTMFDAAATRFVPYIEAQVVESIAKVSGGTTIVEDPETGKRSVAKKPKKTAAERQANYRDGKVDDEVPS